MITRVFAGWLVVLGSLGGPASQATGGAGTTSATRPLKQSSRIIYLERGGAGKRREAASTGDVNGLW